MSTRQLDRDTVESPTVNPWLRKPSLAQVRYATNLCRTELAYADRVATIASFQALDFPAMSDLIDQLVEVREQRFARLRRARRRSRR